MDSPLIHFRIKNKYQQIAQKINGELRIIFCFYSRLDLVQNAQSVEEFSKEAFLSLMRTCFDERLYYNCTNISVRFF
jgi:hypothetical protein